MPSTDIDGSPVLILSEAEAKIIFDLYWSVYDPWGSAIVFSKEEEALRQKLAKFLGIVVPKQEPQKKRTK